MDVQMLVALKGASVRGHLHLDASHG
jgi:hypothetical protein